MHLYGTTDGSGAAELVAIPRGNTEQCDVDTDSSQQIPDFSIVIAVFNTDKFLRDAIESVITQDIGFEEHVQLILVDDGSTDESPAICDEYAARYPKNVIVVHQANAGVATARNVGIMLATGRYINCLDSDDMLSVNTLSQVMPFFDKNIKSIDIVAIPMKFFGEKNGDHWQNFKFNKGTRVIHLFGEHEAPLMSTSSAFFSCRVKDKMIFDKRLIISEDNKVVLTILADKCAYGVINTCTYMYRRSGTGSLVGSSMGKPGWYQDYLRYLCLWAIKFYSDRFGYVPAFVQYQLMCDLQWRFISEYDAEQVLGEAGAREYYQLLAEVLVHIDDKYILSQRKIYREHKCLALSIKYGHDATPLLCGSNVLLAYENTVVSSIADQVCTLHFAQISNGCLNLEGTARLYGLSDDVPVGICIKVDGATIPCEDVRPYEKECVYRLGRPIVKANWFRCSIPLDTNVETHSVGIAYVVNDAVIALRELRLGKFMPITRRLASSYYWADGWAMSSNKHQLRLTKCGRRGLFLHERALRKELATSKNEDVRRCAGVRARYFVKRAMKRKPIWLISDRVMKADDNGEAFFKYLCKYHYNSIDPYFVISKDSIDYNRIKEIGNVVDAYSQEHEMLYLLCDYNISSQANDPDLRPLANDGFPYIDIIFNKKNIFLQHGVIKDDLSTWLCRKNKNLRGFVTSAEPEYLSVVDGDYDYSDQEIWLTGLPRFDLLRNNDKKVITIMPTWRHYLVDALDPLTLTWTLVDGFMDSEYYTTYSEIINDSKFIDCIEQYEYELKFMPHPNFQPHASVFEHDPRVEVLGMETRYQDVYAESSLLVTDYSSTVFDFAYMRKPVLYFQFDKDKFFSGEHTYTKGYFDYIDDGFGEVETTPDGIKERIIEYIASGCELKDKYRSRIDKFYAFDDRNNSERVYNKIINLKDGN
ncbi:CDP-glycerol glycerophosphotransferase family protein [bacterium]|nr:CDP-glycerol glycerophosphotransferase family protein [bacterium]